LLRRELFESPATQPRSHVKAQLLNVVAFDRDFGAVLRTARYAETLRWVWAVALFVVGSAFASVVLLNGYFNRTQLHMQTMPTQASVVTDTSLIADFMAQDDILTLRFVPDAAMRTSTLQGYIHPTQSGILLVGRDFPQIPTPGAYVAWIIDGTHITWVGTFALDATGTAWVYMPKRTLCDTCALLVTRESTRMPTVPADTHAFNMVYSR
jgi:hypothetical protein